MGRNVDGRDVPKVTLTERRALELSYNLADAQNYVDLSPTQQEITDRLGSVFDLARREPYSEVEQRFLRALFHTLGQSAALKSNNCSFLCYSATIGLEIAANFIKSMRSNGKKVGLIHPTFDTLAYIASRHGLPVVAVEERELNEPTTALETHDLSALILTLPNNPTGYHMNRAQFVRLVESCRSSGTLLVIDSCYRYYCQENDAFDYYEVLEDSQVDYLLVEDTGKLFPLVDIKLGVLNCNKRIFSLVESIHLDFLLEVSKFSLTVITDFLEAQTRKEKKSYLDLIEDNRRTLITELESLGVEPVGGSNINVQLLDLPMAMKSVALQKTLLLKGVGVVNAKKLYWAGDPVGDRRIRVALSREAHYFRDGVAIMHGAIAQEGRG